MSCEECRAEMTRLKNKIEDMAEELEQALLERDEQKEMNERYYEVLDNVYYTIDKVLGGGI